MTPSLPLASVAFDRPLEIPSGSTTEHVTAVASRADRRLIANYEKGVVEVGDDGFEIPFARCNSWFRYKGEGVVCPECSQVCQDARGLGAHRFRVHGIRAKDAAED